MSRTEIAVSLRAESLARRGRTRGILPAGGEAPAPRERTMEPDACPDTFELGPIRPPSEAGSYLVRLTRGCPWNRCAFCRTYKRRTFSLRPVEEIVADIDAMARVRDRLRGAAAGSPRGGRRSSRSAGRRVGKHVPNGDRRLPPR